VRIPYLSAMAFIFCQYPGGYLMQPEDPDSPSRIIAATLSGFSN